MIIFAVCHGYFAAWLAVWMLFYPREAKFIGRRRVPFTPGLIPASRKSLEEAIADAVAMQLLRPELLEDAANKQGLPKLIRTALPDHLDKLADDKEFQELLGQGIAQAMKEYLRSCRGIKMELQETHLILYKQAAGLAFDAVIAKLWAHLEGAVDKFCQSNRFRQAMKEAVLHLSTELKTDGTPLASKVEETAAKMLGTAMNSLDVRSVVLERLAGFSTEEIEHLVHTAAGDQLQSIKNVAAVIGVFFGILSALLFR